MPTERDLFAEEQQMVSMSFGDHLEELRARLILALMGLCVGVLVTFIPPLNLGARVVRFMQEPAEEALKEFYATRAAERSERARVREELERQQGHRLTEEYPPLRVAIPARSLVEGLRQVVPDLKAVPPEELEGKDIELPLTIPQSGMITAVHEAAEARPATISLGPLEPVVIFFMVCLVTGLVLSSPWVFYQIWAFIAAGLYRHEQAYVKKFLPFSIGLFLGGVMLCFFGVLPVTMRFLLQFNVWLGIEPTLRISEWMSFATILPLVFGLCFQTPLVMLFLERIGVFTVDDYRAKRRFAILIMVIIAAAVTPGPDVFSQLMLATPMIALYELGIILVARKKEETPAALAG